MKILPYFCLATCLTVLRAAPVTVQSPDGRVELSVTIAADGHLSYRVSSDGHVRLRDAAAGIIVNKNDLGAHAELGSVTRRAIDERFPWRGNKTSAVNRCNVADVSIQTRASDKTISWVLEARVFDDGAAFRYRVPGAGRRHVAGESTTWQLPPAATVWFQTNPVNYEEVYRAETAAALPTELKDRKGVAQRVHLGPPATICFEDGAYGLISEAALRRYSGLTLRPEGGARLSAAFRDDATGWEHDGEILSPWRVIVVARDLDGLVNSDVIAALCEAPDPTLFPGGMNTDWIKPGKSICTWMVFGNDGGAWERQKWFVDRCAAIGCEYLLVDGGWQSAQWGWLKDGGDPWARAAELVRYGRERGVGILLWHAYRENRKDGPGLTRPEARELFLRRCRDAGVAGVKVDFFDSESKAVVEAREDILRIAAEYHLAVNFHGANKPTGEPRTWPNEVTREGIREQEYLLSGQLPLSHYGALPFTRMAAGHGDFLPGFVRAHYLKNTTLTFQMASVIVFSTPFLCWPDHPDAYLQSSVLPFVRTVPVTWDETRVLPGSAIGSAVVMARRKGNEWYVAALNCRGEPAELTIDLSALPGIENATVLTVYRDGERPESCRIDERTVLPPERRVTAHLASGGGLLLQINPPPLPPPLKK